MMTRLTFLSLLALGLPACGDKPQTSDTDGSSAASSGEATDGGTVGVSSEPTTSGDASTTGDASPTAVSVSSVATEDSAGSATTDPDETSAGGTGGVDPELAKLCGEVCGRFVECEQADDQDACAAECSDNFGTADLACQGAATDLLACVDGMTCAQIVAFLDDEDPGPCAAQLAAHAEACGGNECTASIGAAEDGTACNLFHDCPDEPTREMSCDTVTCTCSVGGVPSDRTCPADNVCQTLEGIEDKAKTCCGF